MRLCVACKLHTLSSPHILSYFPTSILPTPTDALEVRDRVHTFWLAFILDRYGGMLCGLNNSINDEVRQLYIQKYTHPLIFFELRISQPFSPQAR
jgi:hypothetical protein